MGKRRRFLPGSVGKFREIPIGSVRPGLFFKYLCTGIIVDNNGTPVPTTMDKKTPLLGMTPEELQDVARSLGMPAFAGKQMAEWLYKKRVKNIDAMTNLSLRHRQSLKQAYDIGAEPPIDAQRSADGTVKYLYRAGGRHGQTGGGGGFVESVFIPEDGRATLCVSSQIGCKMGCAFCMTGRQGFNGQLTAAEILNQIYSLPEAGRLTNLVFMGMGEPMDNIDAVLRALRALTSPWGYGWSPRRITVSTIGLRHGLERFLQESECHLAISLHSAVPALRRTLMPAEQAFPIEEIMETLRAKDWGGQRRLSFEYIVFHKLNDTPFQRNALLRLLRGLECRVNLIRFHAIPGSSLQGTDEEALLGLRDFLTGHGIFTTIRASRGEDIFAACGMLSTLKQQEGGHGGYREKEEG